jgi:large subunit ribosomal protein L10
MDGKVLGADEVRRLATLESRDVLLARLAGLLQASAQQTVNLLAAPLRQVATMTAALRDKQRGEAPAEPARGRRPGRGGPGRRGRPTPAAEAADQPAE